MFTSKQRKILIGVVQEEIERLETDETDYTNDLEFDPENENLKEHLRETSKEIMELKGILKILERNG